MYLFELKHKLAKLNPKLYINEKSRKEIKPGYFTTGIYLRDSGRHARGLNNFQIQYADRDQRRRLEDDYAGHIDKFLCGCPIEWISEWDTIDPETKQVIAIGWRSIVKQLLRCKVIDLNRARKVFDCASLMEADYDRIGLDGKVQLARKEANYAG